MFKRFTIPALALATVMAVAAPALTLGEDRDDHRGREFSQRNDYRDRARTEYRDRDRDRDRDYDRGGPDRDDPRWDREHAYVQPRVQGYYDRDGNWRPAGNYYR